MLLLLTAALAALAVVRAADTPPKPLPDVAGDMATLDMAAEALLGRDVTLSLLSQADRTKVITAVQNGAPDGAQEPTANALTGAGAKTAVDGLKAMALSSLAERATVRTPRAAAARALRRYCRKAGESDVPELVALPAEEADGTVKEVLVENADAVEDFIKQRTALVKAAARCARLRVGVARALGRHLLVRSLVKRLVTVMRAAAAGQVVKVVSFLKKVKAKYTGKTFKELFTATGGNTTAGDLIDDVPEVAAPEGVHRGLRAYKLARARVTGAKRVPPRIPLFIKTAIVKVATLFAFDANNAFTVPQRKAIVEAALFFNVAQALSQQRGPAAGLIDAERCYNVAHIDLVFLMRAHVRAVSAGLALKEFLGKAVTDANIDTELANADLADVDNLPNPVANAKVGKFRNSVRAAVEFLADHQWVRASFRISVAFRKACDRRLARGVVAARVCTKRVAQAMAALKRQREAAAKLVVFVKAQAAKVTAMRRLFAALAEKCKAMPDACDDAKMAFKTAVMELKAALPAELKAFATKVRCAPRRALLRMKLRGVCTSNQTDAECGAAVQEYIGDKLEELDDESFEARCGADGAQCDGAAFARLKARRAKFALKKAAFRRVLRAIIVHKIKNRAATDAADDAIAADADDVDVINPEAVAEKDEDGDDEGEDEDGDNEDVEAELLVAQTVDPTAGQQRKRAPDDVPIADIIDVITADDAQQFAPPAEDAAVGAGSLPATEACAATFCDADVAAAEAAAGLESTLPTGDVGDEAPAPGSAGTPGTGGNTPGADGTTPSGDGGMMGADDDAAGALVASLATVALTALVAVAA